MSYILFTLLCLSLNIKGLFSRNCVLTANITNQDVRIAIKCPEVHEFSVTAQSHDSPALCDSSTAVLCVIWGVLGPKLLIFKDNRHFKVQFKDGSDVVFHFPFSGHHLYGGPVASVWPNDRHTINRAPYISGFPGIGALEERLWYISSGLAIKVDSKSHLYVSQNSSDLLLHFDDKPPYLTQQATIQFEICPSENVKGLLSCFPPRARYIDRQIISHPIWSTWVWFKKFIDQEKLLGFVEDIEKNNFNISILEIDDMWETCYGNHQWDLKRFPNPAKMIDALNKKGIKVTLWVHPFVNEECEFFMTARRYLYKDTEGTVSLVNWWNGRAGLIDFTSPAARNWFIARLKQLKTSLGLAGFKFDAGESSYIPGLVTGNATLSYPDQFTHEYVNLAAKFGISEARVGANNQEQEFLERLQDTESTWDWRKNGLQSVLPNMLTASLLGYQAVVPDMVGGNSYWSTMTKELYIRWLQLNTFLPLIQLSVPPWHFDNQTVEITRSMLALRSSYADLLQFLIQSPEKRVVTPVWYYSPNDSIALTIDSEFLVGDSLLVAPVVEEGAVSRDVYLPTGHWANPDKSAIFTGPLLLSNYSAPLHVLPYFVRVNVSQAVVKVVH